MMLMSFTLCLITTRGIIFTQQLLNTASDRFTVKSCMWNYRTTSSVNTFENSKRFLTIGKHVKWLAIGVHGGQARSFWRDGAPPLEGRLQRWRPVGHNAQLLAPHGHHLGPLSLWQVGVWLLDCRWAEEKQIWVRQSCFYISHIFWTSFLWIMEFCCHYKAIKNIFVCYTDPLSDKCIIKKHNTYSDFLKFLLDEWIKV